jgi:hypothetical protein
MVSLFNIRMRIGLDAYWIRVVAHRLGAVMAIATLLNGMAAIQDFAGGGRLSIVWGLHLAVATCHNDQKMMAGIATDVSLRFPVKVAALVFLAEVVVLVFLITTALLDSVSAATRDI